MVGGLKGYERKLKLSLDVTNPKWHPLHPPASFNISARRRKKILDKNKWFKKTADNDDDASIHQANTSDQQEDIPIHQQDNNTQQEDIHIHTDEEAIRDNYEESRHEEDINSRTHRGEDIINKINKDPIGHQKILRDTKK